MSSVLGLLEANFSNFFTNVPYFMTTNDKRPFVVYSFTAKNID